MALTDLKNFYLEHMAAGVWKNPYLYKVFVKISEAYISADIFSNHFVKLFKFTIEFFKRKSVIILMKSISCQLLSSFKL